MIYFRPSTAVAVAIITGHLVTALSCLRSAHCTWSSLIFPKWRENRSTRRRSKVFESDSPTPQNRWACILTIWIRVRAAGASITPHWPGLVTRFTNIFWRNGCAPTEETCRQGRCTMKRWRPSSGTCWKKVMVAITTLVIIGSVVWSRKWITWPVSPVSVVSFGVTCKDWWDMCFRVSCSFGREMQMRQSDNLRRKWKESTCFWKKCQNLEFEQDVTVKASSTCPENQCKSHEKSVSFNFYPKRNFLSYDCSYDR